MLHNDDLWWGVGGWRGICNQRKLLQTNPCRIFSSQWCIASQPTLRQKLEHNQHSSYSWTLSPWLTMNNKVCWFVFSYFRREWHATSDIVLAWHIVTLTRTLSSWVSWPVPMCLSWYVTVLSFLSLSYHSGLFSPRAECLLVTIWWSWSFLLCCCCSMFQKIRVLHSFSVSPLPSSIW